MLVFLVLCYSGIFVHFSMASVAFVAPPCQCRHSGTLWWPRHSLNPGRGHAGVSIHTRLLVDNMEDCRLGFVSIG